MSELLFFIIGLIIGGLATTTQEIERLISEEKETKKQLEKIGFKSEENKRWIETFKSIGHIENLNKIIVNELVQDIYIYNDGNITIKFRYEDEFFEAIDFIKHHNCDIIGEAKVSWLESFPNKTKLIEP